MKKINFLPIKSLLYIVVLFVSAPSIAQKPMLLKEYSDSYLKQYSVDTLENSKTVNISSSSVVQDYEELVLFWRNGDWNDTIHKTAYFFNGDGKVIEWLHYLYENGIFEAGRKVNYSYSSNGLLAEETISLKNQGG